MVLFLLTACAGEADNQTNGDQTVIDPVTAETEVVQESPAEIVQDERFRATAGADGSVRLDWDSFAGAEQYLLEFQVGGLSTCRLCSWRVTKPLTRMWMWRRKQNTFTG